MQKYRKGSLEELKYNFPISNEIASKIHKLYGCNAFNICKRLYFNNFYFNDLKNNSEEEYLKIIEEMVKNY